MIDPIELYLRRRGPDGQVLAEGLDHPEGIAYGPDGMVYAGGEAGQVYRVDASDGTVVQLATTGGFVLGVTLDAAGRVFCCDAGHRAVLRVDADGSVAVVSRGAPGRSFAPNHLVFAADGHLYVSDSGSWPEGGGTIQRISPDGTTEVWSDGPGAVTNGLALGPDGRHLYAVESTRPGVSRVEIRADGSAGPCAEVVRLPGTVPDGLAFDRDGNLYVSCYRPDAIYRLSPDGEVTCVAADWQGTRLAAPTNIAFVGAGLDRLATANLGRWHLAVLDVGAAGHPLHHPPTEHPVAEWLVPPPGGAS